MFKISIFSMFLMMLGSANLILAVLFIYYSIKNAVKLKGAVTEYLMVAGALFFVVFSLFSAIEFIIFDISLATGYPAFIIGFLLISAGEIYSNRVIHKAVGKGSYLTAARVSSYKRYRLGALFTILIFVIPLLIMMSVMEFTQTHILATTLLILLSFILLLAGERRLFITTNVLSSAENLLEDMSDIHLLREDIAAVRIYVDILNIFFSLVKPMMNPKIVDSNLSDWSEEHPVLFEDCLGVGGSKIDEKRIIRNLDRLFEKERTSTVLKEFSILVDRFFDIYSGITSPEHAREMFAKSFRTVKRRYDEVPIIFDIIRTTPNGVLEDDKLALMNREELEAKVKKRTRELEETLDELKRTSIELVREKAFTESIISHMPDMVFAIDMNRRVTYINETLSEFSGKKAEEVLGKDLVQLIIKTGIVTKESIKTVLKRAREWKYDGEPVPISNVEIEMKNNRGERMIGSYSSAIIETSDGEKLGEVITIRDITKRKQAEEEIRAKNEELQVIGEELSELNQNLEEKVEERTAEVENLLRQKDEFVNQLGHDLKSPLTPLVTLLPIIEQREKDKEIKELIGVIIENVNFMKELVVKTLSLAKLNSPSTEFNMDDINLSEEVGSAIRTKVHLFKERNILVDDRIGEDIIVKADKLRLGELFDNLITNAVKYSQEAGGTLTIDAEMKDDFVVVSVKDSGIGMIEEQLNHIFEEFYKVDPSRHDLDSSGLGLSICKRIVEKHGGKIWADSLGEGQGTTFYFTLKLVDERLKKTTPLIKPLPPSVH
ncbi:MAG: PAS domain-containing sensor histidine kinase [Halobacteriota archaeon]|nr:PAS domain-containing sensor histidine kinase [Halobacteriota archaeon]